MTTETEELTPMLVWVNEVELSHALYDAKNTRSKLEKFLKALVPFNVPMPKNGIDANYIAYHPEEYIKEELKKELEAELTVGKRKMNPDKYLETLDLPDFLEVSKSGRELTESRDSSSFVGLMEISYTKEGIQVELPEGFEEKLKRSYSKFAETEKEIEVITGIEKFIDAYEEFEREVLKITDIERRHTHREKTTINDLLKKKDLFFRLTRF